jgi:hypothetical protein
VTSASTLVYRDPYGEVGYYKVVGDWSRTWKKAAGAQMHTTKLPLVEVAPPTTVVSGLL